MSFSVDLSQTLPEGEEITETKETRIFAQSLTPSSTYFRLGAYLLCLLSFALLSLCVFLLSGLQKSQYNAVTKYDVGGKLTRTSKMRVRLCYGERCRESPRREGGILGSDNQKRDYCGIINDFRFMSEWNMHDTLSEGSNTSD